MRRGAADPDLIVIGILIGDLLVGKAGAPEVAPDAARTAHYNDNDEVAEKAPNNGAGEEVLPKVLGSGRACAARGGKQTDASGASGNCERTNTDKRASGVPTVLESWRAAGRWKGVQSAGAQGESAGGGTEMKGAKEATRGSEGK